MSKRLELYRSHYKEDIYASNDDYYLVCKKTQKTFQKWKRTACLTAHLKREDIPFKAPNSVWSRKKYYYDNNTYWYMSFFDLRHKDDVQLNEGGVNFNIPIAKDKNSSNSKKALQCKITKKIFTKWNNTTAITKHLIENNISYDKPKSPYHVRKYFIENGTYWYMKYFRLIDIIPSKQHKCRYCNDTFNIEKSGHGFGWYKKHLIEKHNIVVKDYLEKFPTDKKFFNVDILKKNRKKRIDSDYIQCEVCKLKCLQITPAHLKMHNMTMIEYRDKYPNAKLVNDNLTKKYGDRLKKYNADGKTVHYRSKCEIAICDFISSHGITCEPNNRKILQGIELDIYIPSHNLAIECNGNYYHSEQFKPKISHIMKTEMSEILGIQLLHIHSDEWLHSKEIVLSKLSSILRINTNKKKVYARKCTIKEISSYEKNTFLEQNHIQGGDKSSIKLGLYNNKDLVSVMTFRKNELTRFANRIDTIAIGCFEKLLKYYIRNYNPYSIVSFADRRWSTNIKPNLYDRSGFKLIKIGAIDYKYHNKNRAYLDKRFHKQNFRKKKIIQRYPNNGFDMSMTETQMTKSLGFEKIWDCGLFKYELICI